jgi:hypothetical protein
VAWRNIPHLHYTTETLQETYNPDSIVVIILSRSGAVHPFTIRTWLYYSRPTLHEPYNPDFNVVIIGPRSLPVHPRLAFEYMYYNTGSLQETYKDKDPP